MSLSKLLNTAPVDTHGVEIGYLSWRYVVELVLPSQPGAVVGTAVVGATKVATDEWVDITDYVRGSDIEIGASSLDRRGDPGTLEFTLASPAHIFAPWLTSLDSFHGSARKFRPGLLIRAGLVTPGGWWPIATGEVETWRESSTQSDADVWVDVVAVETTKRLTETLLTITDGPLFAFALGDPIADQVLDILDRADWPYGVVVPESLNPNALSVQAVDDLEGVAALNLLRAVAEATFRECRSDGTGRLFMPIREPSIYWEHFGIDNGLTAINLTHPTDVIPDRLVMATDDEALINVVERVDPRGEVFGTYVSDPASIALYGERVYSIPNLVRAQFINPVDLYPAALPDLIEGVDIVAAYADLVNRVESLELDHRHFDHIILTDLDTPVTITHHPKTSPAGFTATGWVRTIRHTITHDQSPIRWNTTYGIDTHTLEIT